MPQLYNDLLFASVFVVVLLVLAGFKKRVFEKEQASFRRIVFGLMFLIGFSVIQLAGNQGFFFGWNYIGDEAGRKMVEAAAIVGGLIFLLSGVSSWLPSLARNNDNRRRLNKRYYALKMINEVIVQDKSIDKTYSEVAGQLTSYLGFRRCLAYKLSASREKLYLAGASGSNDGKIAAPKTIDLREVKIDSVMERGRTERLSGEICGWGNDSLPCLLIPIFDKNRIYGAYFCQAAENIEFDDDLIDFASVIGTITGRYTAGRVAEKREAYHKQQQTAYERVNELSNLSASIRDILPGFFRVVKELTGAEYLSLATLDNSGENMIRYTIGSSGRMLLEKGVSRQTRGTDIFRVFKAGHPIIESELRSDDRGVESDGLLLSCGMRCKMLYPVKAMKKVVGVVTLGHSRPWHFSALHQRRLQGTSEALAGVISREQLKRTLEIKEDHMLRLQLMQRQMLEDFPAEKFFDQACDMLANRMKCTMARISLIDKGENNLISQACRSIRDTGHELRVGETIPLSLLPWHRMTRDARKLMLINQDDPESRMPPQESTSALIPNIKSAMLVPILLNDQVRGIISIGEARNWNRRAFNAGDLIFAKDMAAKCSVALRLKQLQLESERSRERMNQMPIEDGRESEIISRIKSPLTSIIGAVELLQRKGQTDEFSSRYYNMILKSADRIKDFTEKTDSAEVTFGKVESGPVAG